jgi:hypothetical protein
VLISSTHVLTAEHCLENLNDQMIEILIGSGKLSQSISYYLLWWYTYNQWISDNGLKKTTSYNDIAVIKVNKFVKK